MNIKHMAQKHITRFIACLWPFGASPIAPGTMGSIPAVFVGYAINLYYGAVATFVVAIVICILGLWAIKHYCAQTGKHDPKEVVIDEFVGQLIACSAAGVMIWAHVVAFLAFRVLDITKPGLIRKIERWPGALGVMGDDVLAGILAGILVVVLQLLPLSHYLA